MAGLRLLVVGALLVSACTGSRAEVQDPAVSPPPPTAALGATDAPTASTTPTVTETASGHEGSSVTASADAGATADASPTAPAPPSPSPTPASPEPSPEPTPALYFPPSAPFRSSVSEVVGHPVRDRMVGVSWREECPVPLEALRYLTLSHVGLDGAVHTGELVVHADVVGPVLAAMQEMYEVGFPIDRMRLVSDYGADDGASMRANNTSGYNCRTVAGTTRWSNHAYGTAIDINPLRNPYVKGGAVDPPEGAAWADRSNRRPGMLYAGTAELQAWTRRGWDWGGSWSSGQDYQHVSATGG